MKKLANYKEMINKEIEKTRKENLKWGKNEDAVLRPITQVGSGKRSTYSTDHTDEYVKYLEELGYDYEIGNDSPRGGKLGKYIKVKVNKVNA